MEYNEFRENTSVNEHGHSSPLPREGQGVGLTSSNEHGQSSPLPREGQGVGLRIVIKVGSNVLTRKDGHLDITRM